MKRIIIQDTIPFLVLLAFGMMLLTSCDKDDDDEKSARNDIYALEPPYIYGSALLPTEKVWNFTLKNSWTSTSGHSFDVFILQDGNFKSVGHIHSNEKSITNAYEALHINVPIPTSIDVSRSYQMIAVDGELEARLKNGNISFSMDLERGDTNVPGWYVAQGGNGVKAQSFFTAASEYLHIKNNSSKTIKVKQKGYDTNQKWYYDKGNMSITSGLKIVGNGSAGDKNSSTIEIPAGEEDVILSRYVASGNNITNASAVLEIDGKEVKTPPVSSSVTIENGGHYRLFVKWGGTNLEWWRK